MLIAFRCQPGPASGLAQGTAWRGGLRVGTCRSLGLEVGGSLAGTRAAEGTLPALNSTPWPRALPPQAGPRHISSTEMRPRSNSSGFRLCCSPRGAGGWPHVPPLPGPPALPGDHRGISRGDHIAAEPFLYLFICLFLSGFGETSPPYL